MVPAHLMHLNAGPSGVENRVRPMMFIGRAHTPNALCAQRSGFDFLAAPFNAHLDAVAIGYVATSAAYVMEGGAAVAAVFELERERAVVRAGDGSLRPLAIAAARSRRRHPHHAGSHDSPDAVPD
jgi:hypothetical protein